MSSCLLGLRLWLHRSPGNTATQLLSSDGLWLHFMLLHFVEGSVWTYEGACRVEQLMISWQALGSDPAGLEWNCERRRLKSCVSSQGLHPWKCTVEGRLRHNAV